MVWVRTVTFSVWVAVFGLCAFGLATPTAARGDDAAKDDAAKDTRPSAPKRGAEKPKAAPGTQGVMVDRFDIELRVDDLRFYEVSSGFLSSGRGKALKELRLWHGAHEIWVDVKRLRRVDVFLDEVDKKNDLVWIRVTLKDGTKSKAKVERTLEVRGKVHLGRYKIRIDRVKRIEFDR